MEIEDGFNETKMQQTNIDPEKFIVECMERAKIEKANMSVRRGQGSSTIPDQIDEGEQIVRNAKAAKARLYAIPGMSSNFQGNHLVENINWPTVNSSQAMAAATVDENYLVIGSHIDAVLQLKIINNEYVDFVK